MAKIRIKKGDTVQVIAGSSDDRGRTGKVVSVDRDRNRVLVEGINRIKKHTKTGTSGRGAKTGGIITQEAPIHISNVMLVDPETKKPTRVGIRVETVERDGVIKRTRVRVAKRSGKDI
ncbi:MAG: large subunit ribosomal protein [Actinomycetota bacterium]|nr:large subunit ribosomal protein [Actinomycetota bacterium]